MTSRKTRKRAAIAPYVAELERSHVLPGVIKQVGPLLRLLVGAQPQPAGDLPISIARLHQDGERRLVWLGDPWQGLPRWRLTPVGAAAANNHPRQAAAP